MDLMQKRVDLGLIDPGNLNRYYMYYNIGPLTQFLSNIPKYDLPITKTETVYVESKSISQTKLRETGFKITRSKDNATFIIVDNFLKLDNSIGWSTEKSFRFNNRTKSEDFLDNRIKDLDKDYKYIQTKVY